MATAPRPRQGSSLEQRLNQLERLLVAQQERMTTQEAEIIAQREEIVQLRAVGAGAAASLPNPMPSVAPMADVATVDALTEQAAPTKRTSRSRRALLKLGGAAAAAGVAATAALVTSEGGQTAHAADGNNLVIGQFNYGSTETYLGVVGSPALATVFAADTSGSTYTSPTAVFGLAGTANGVGVYGYASTSATGVYGQSTSGTGVSGISTTGTAMRGSSTSGYGVHATSNSAAGVYANSVNSTGVVGTSTSGVGVSGSSSTNAGVYAQTNSTTTAAVYAYGTAANGKAVWGYAPTGTAIEGQTDSGTGVWGYGGSGLGGQFSGGRAPLSLVPGGAPGAPASGAHVIGDIYLDSLATVWVCIGSGTPGIWVRLLSAPNGTLGGGITYLSSPIRLLDARTSPGSALVTRGPLNANETYAFTVAGLGGSGIPASAQGLIANMTVLGPSGAGNLSLFPAPGPGPSVASMTFGTPGLFLANGVNVAIGTAGQIEIQNQSSGTTPLVLDAVAFVS
jgi:hypothetical protein